MTSNQRREKILEMLKESRDPLSAAAIAGNFQVSRQLIVGDIALLRAAGEEIAATPRGYVMARRESGGIRRTIACRHTSEEMGKELYTIVDNGGAVLDVIVEHAVYGQISGQLHIFSRYDVNQFLEKVSREQVSPLSRLTDGIHLHTILCQDEAAYQRVLGALQKKHLLFEKNR